MNIIKVLKPDFSFSDERGEIIQLVSKGYNQVNFVNTKKGSLRGNFHYHKRNKELFYIIKGKIILTVEKNNETETKAFSSGEMFLIDEYVKHKFEFLEDTELIGLYSDKVENDDGTKDIFEE